MTRVNTTEANAGLADLLHSARTGRGLAERENEEGHHIRDAWVHQMLTKTLPEKVEELTALVADLTAANSALAADNARLGKRVDDARVLVGFYANLTSSRENRDAALAWLAGGEA